MNPFSIIALFLIIGLVVFIHEFGHFLLAKKNGVGVIEFSIGMGPRLLSTIHKGTRYSLKWIPFGGSCLMLGDDNGIVTCLSPGFLSGWNWIAFFRYAFLISSTVAVFDTSSTS